MEQIRKAFASKKSQKFEYLENEMSFQMKQKAFFTVFKELSFGEKIKI